jgi:hypothetical protein
MNDFKPGERIVIKGGEAPMYFVGKVGDTVWTTRNKPGIGVNAEAYTDREWERYSPFFEEGKTYRHAVMSTRVTVHQVGKVGRHKYAAGLNTGGSLYLLEDDDLEYWVED